MWKSYSHRGLAALFSILERGVIFTQECQPAVIKNRYATCRRHIVVSRGPGGKFQGPAFNRQVECVGHPGEVVEEAHGKREFHLCESSKRALTRRYSESSIPLAFVDTAVA